MDRETESQVEIFVAFMAVWQTLEYSRSSSALKTLLLAKKIFKNLKVRVSS